MRKSRNKIPTGSDALLADKSSAAGLPILMSAILKAIVRDDIIDLPLNLEQIRGRAPVLMSFGLRKWSEEFDETWCYAALFLIGKVGT